MQPLTAQQMLQVWDEGQPRPLPQRALLLLAEACPDESWDALAALPIGRRDDRLLTLREWAFGSTLSGLARCPVCSERIELSFSIDDLRAGATPAADGELSVAIRGYDVRFRLPDSTDVFAINGAADTSASRQLLLQRCVLGARRNGRSRSSKRLPASVLEAVVREMAELDPQADVHTELRCPACAHAWRAAFDIASYFWAEIESWAARTLREVHALASAYAWREADILSLTPWRRRFYLEMVYR